MMTSTTDGEVDGIIGDGQVRFLPKPTIPPEDIYSLPIRMDRLEEVLVLGAGTSSSIPHIACLTEEHSSTSTPCLVCLDGAGRVERTAKYKMLHGGPPSRLPSRNRRTNPSSLLRYRHSDGTLHSILLDCGKSFYSRMDCMVAGGVRVLDGVILTHGHADAILGLDDLRHWAGAHPRIQESVSVYCDSDTFEVIKAIFPYLVDPQRATGGGEVSAIKFVVFERGTSFMVGEMEVLSVPVYHGEYSDGKPYYANGFVIEGLTYLSDISGIPKRSLNLLLERTSANQILVIDCLFEDWHYKSHYGLVQARQLIKKLSPKVSILVGMAHTIDYYRLQTNLDRDAGIASESNDGSIGKLNYVDGRILVGFDGLLLKMQS